MIRQPMLRLRGVGRLTIGLLGVATVLLLAPPAMAQPEVDANNAITAAWDASGGDTGPLGPRTGEVYPVGEGFAQNFAAGTMFFTPDTGAHFMQGAILEKYQASGGPADGDLGFPTIDEGPGRAPESRNSTFSAPDNPVIFWTPATGARIVRGPINAAWDKLGGSSGVLGVPAEDETYNGSVVSQKFTGGELTYDARTKTFTTVPPELAGQLADLSIPDDPVAAINAARRAAGGPLGPLGAVEGEVYDIGADGKGQDFANGAIYYSPDTGANVVTGQVLEKYKSVGGPEGDLGFPISGEEDGGLTPASRKSAFAAEDKPVIFWTPDHGAFIVRGPIVAAWDKLGGATGELGAPVADQTESGNTLSQRFSGGVISWDTSARTFSTEPAGLASQLTDVVVPGADAPQATPPTPQAAENNEDTGRKWNKWWLLAVVPLLLLAGLVAFAVMRHRARPGEDDMFTAPGAVGHDPQDPETDGHDGPHGDDGREDALFGDRYAREGLGSVASANPEAPQDEEFAPQPLSFWGVPVQPEGGADAGDEEPQIDPDAVDTTPTRIPTPSEVAGDSPFVDVETAASEDEFDESEDEFDEADDEFDESEDEFDDLAVVDEDADLAADREPLVPPVPIPVRDGLTDTGRHARIDIDEPMPLGTALHMPLEDSDQIPDGYPVKADTKSGLYWTPDSADYHEAPVELWFASEEIARTNGFVRGE
ncbi:LGFP repeat-containing protein [Mycolicibacterium sp. PAM1]|uniref:LGFP repeat protein n=1 Tax=Mycolicibacterium gilvum (strain PYR-GCK) TaxID=350054 RepID=A4TCP0_MYCGI|nr:LGFP repeat-containing protein [Mycolicibacterium sp. PAM1]ABP46428.1 LGFP repeat protein [Mycolicibacterium gilvum PYR-GCK]MBV5244550.1 LGFP repeat-containing protein [Mycolicibacterium sp. PAM1]